MHRPRLSIRGLMLTVAWAAVATAALVGPSRLWATALMSGMLGALTLALSAICYCNGPARVFWSGFAVSGWLFMAVHFGPWCSDHVAPYLIPACICEVAYEAIHGDVSFGSTPSLTEFVTVAETISSPRGGADVLVKQVPQTTLLGVNERAVAWSWWVSPETSYLGDGRLATPRSFYRIGTTLLGILWAYLGGLAAQRLARGATRVTQTMEAPVSTETR